MHRGAKRYGNLRRDRCRPDRAAAQPTARTRSPTPTANETSRIESLLPASYSAARKPRDGSGTVFPRCVAGAAAQAPLGLTASQITVCIARALEKIGSGIRERLAAIGGHTIRINSAGCACALRGVLTGAAGALERLSARSSRAVAPEIASRRFGPASGDHHRSDEPDDRTGQTGGAPPASGCRHCVRSARAPRACGRSSPQFWVR